MEQSTWRVLMFRALPACMTYPFDIFGDDEQYNSQSLHFLVLIFRNLEGTPVLRNQATSKVKL